MTPPPVALAHTAALSPDQLAAARALIYRCFDDMTESDWEHALGGMHALAYDEQGELIGHAALVQRRLVHRGRALRTGYVEAVGVGPAHRRRGHAGRLMAELERVIRGAYELGALGATDVGARLYAARGWQRWRGPTSALTPAGVVRTPEEDGCVFVFGARVELDFTGELTCDYRDGDAW